MIEISLYILTYLVTGLIIAKYFQLWVNKTSCLPLDMGAFFVCIIIWPVCVFIILVAWLIQLWIWFFKLWDKS